MPFLRRRLVTAALTSNALHPVPGPRAGIVSFVAGTLAGELAPHLLATTVIDSLVEVARGRRGVPALALAGLTLGGLGFLVQESRRAGDRIEAGLRETLGPEDGPPATPLDLGTPWGLLALPFRKRGADVHVERDIAYTDAGRRGHLDIYLPAHGQTDAAPVLLQVHGGAWSIGQKHHQGVSLMRHMASRGWVCVAINYRLAPRDPFPAQIIDVKKAVAWVRRHIADYGGNPEYVAITGGSAGGHLAALAALTPNDAAYQPGFEDSDTTVQVAVPLYGVYDFAGATGLRSAIAMRDGFLAPRILGRPPTEAALDLEAASPILRVTAGAPDFFVLHGDRDTMVSVRQARRFVDRLRAESDASVVYAELPGAQHAFDTFPSIRSAHVVRAIERYLHWHHARATNASAPTGRPRC